MKLAVISLMLACCLLVVKAREYNCEQEVEGRPYCRLPAKTGWYYNKDTQTCKTFHWANCPGNDNNFDSKQECLRRCGGL
ncbi:PREDICTED: boophilin-H2-like [Priapulus caudatus]|uniref:Boophilin-H2-like n=1 Tax=Priapulus caudatus TaxID=37621 RepID=A0ABM1E0R0_PRICU|nr:PREDICTED: boophilin-H2-like [Priapulus caudatus]